MSLPVIAESREANESLQRWDRLVEWPLTVLAAVFLGAYAWPILDDGLSPNWRHACSWTGAAVWVVFGLDFLLRLILAGRRAGHYVVHHLADVLILALPLLRPLRLLRVVMLLRMLNRSANLSLRGRVATYVGGATVLLVFCAALAVLDAERGKPGSNIHDFSDALWWAGSTVTTVGYGDRFPVSGEGRLVAAALMLAGIALLGVVTASIASWLLEQIRDTENQTEVVTLSAVEALSVEVAELRSLLAQSMLDGNQPKESPAAGRSGGP